MQDGRTALYQASQNGHLATVQLLLQRGADVNICDEVRALAVGRCIVCVSCANYDHVQYSVCGLPLVIMACCVQSVLVPSGRADSSVVTCHCCICTFIGSVEVVVMYYRVALLWCV